MLSHILFLQLASHFQCFQLFEKWIAAMSYFFQCNFRYILYKHSRPFCRRYWKLPFFSNSGFEVHQDNIKHLVVFINPSHVRFILVSGVGFFTRIFFFFLNHREIAGITIGGNQNNRLFLWFFVSVWRHQNFLISEIFGFPTSAHTFFCLSWHIFPIFSCCTCNI